VFDRDGSRRRGSCEAGPPVKADVSSDHWGDPAADKVAKATGVYRAPDDPGSLYNATRAIGARDAWSRRDTRGRAITGQGVTVALLDSGIVPVAGLDGAGKVVQGPDLSLENDQDSLLGLDTFGHGTHMAGIIGAADPTGVDRTGKPVNPGPADELGVAPGVALLGTADGSTDVTQVIAALDWVGQHARDDGMNVRVVNLSFGTGSLQPYQIDPLAAAAENAWRHGLVVVVSGGNDGQGAGRLTDPAIDPYVVAVGAADPQLSVNGWNSPVVAPFSNGGSGQRHVDLIAPGTSIASLRDPGSSIDVDHPEGLVNGDTTGRLFRGSGTSQAAAVVSGAAALLVQANPALTPDQVKAALVTTADPLRGVSPLHQGAGELDVTDALDAVQPGRVVRSVASAVQTATPAAGTGSVEASRAGGDLVDPASGAVLSGEVDVQGHQLDTARWATASRAGTAWTGGGWNGAAWSDAGWAAARWSGAGWAAARWSDADWASGRWSGARWSAARWSAARWSAARWSAGSW